MFNQPRICNRTVVDFFINNIRLMLLAVVLISLIHRSISVTSPIYPSCPMERNNEVSESALQTTTRMIESHIRFLQREIQKEVQNLRNEFSAQIDVFYDLCTASGDVSWAKLVDLGERIETVERSLTLTSSESITKAEFINSSKELKCTKQEEELGFNEELKSTILDNLQEIIMNEIEKHAADGLGRVDYAADGGGGMVFGHSPAYGEILFQFEDVLPDFQRPQPQIILKPSFGEPGQCFALNGSSGYVLILLRNRIIPDAITLEHAAKSVAYDRSDAPKDCRVYGFLQRHGDEFIIPGNRIFLAKFTYDLEKHNVQTFDVWQRADPREQVVDTISFEFTSNHGDPTRTCIYRIRVHGHEPDSQSTMIVGMSENDTSHPRDPYDDLFVRLE